MTVRPQAASPVIARQTLTLSGVFSGVQVAARNLLNQTIPGLADHSCLPNTIAQGPATRPQAYVQNPLVAQILSFQPGPGARPARRKVLEVQNDPGPQDDRVINALQRYFHVQPRRQPSADPRDEASVVRHPQGLLSSGARWAQDMFYQFTDNGVAVYQMQPEYRVWGGRLDLEITGAGRTTVSAPATRSSQPGAPAVPLYGYYDSANAAQAAQARLTELLSPSSPGFSTSWVGPPNMVDNPYFDPSFAARNAIRQMQADLALGPDTGIRLGPSNLTDNPYFDPAFTARNTVQFLESALAEGGRSLLSPLGVQAGLARVQQIRDSFFRPGPALSDWS